MAWQENSVYEIRRIIMYSAEPIGFKFGCSDKHLLSYPMGCNKFYYKMTKLCSKIEIAGCPEGPVQNNWLEKINVQPSPLPGMPRCIEAWCSVLFNNDLLY